MTTIRSTLSAFLIVALLAGSGCTLTTSSDPARRGGSRSIEDDLLVQTEKATIVAFETINELIEVDHANRDLVREKFPEIHAFAEDLRRSAPRQLEAARAATKSYKDARSLEAGSRMEESLAQMQSLASSARKYLIELRAAGIENR